MKISLAVLASAVLAYNVAILTANRTQNNKDKTCLTKSSINIDNEVPSIARAMEESFRNFGITQNEKYTATTQGKLLKESKVSKTYVQNYKITVRINTKSWQGRAHDEMVRARALLQVVGTLNLFFDPKNNNNLKGYTYTWKAGITIITNSRLNTDQNAEIFMDQSEAITKTAEARDLALQTKCSNNFPK